MVIRHTATESIDATKHYILKNNGLPNSAELSLYRIPISIADALAEGNQAPLARVAQEAILAPCLTAAVFADRKLMPRCAFAAMLTERSSALPAT